MTRVFLVEDHELVRRGIAQVINSEPDLEVVGESECVRGTVRRITACRPEVVVLDVYLPDGNGIDLIRETSHRYPGTDIMVITVFGDEEHVLAAIEAGATGYILKDSIPEEFVGLITQLRAGGSPISPIIARQLLKRFKSGPTPPDQKPTDDAGLSARESEVLSLIAKGFSFAEIARLLTISTHTVTTHVKKIYQKLAVHSRGEAVYEASKLGLV